MEEDRELEKIKANMLRRMMAQPHKGPWKSGKVTALSGSEFDEVLSGSKIPVLVDFWADWCSPCKMMRPIFEALAQEYAGRVNFAKIDVDKNQTIALRYGVMSIPNFVLFKEGKPVDRVVGAVGKIGLERVLRRYAS